VTTDAADARFANPRSFAALREIARSLSSAWDLDTTLDLIARKTTEMMAVDSCAIYMLDTDDVTLRLRASTGLAREALGLATLQVGEGMTGHAVKENRPVYAADAQHDPHFKWLAGTEEWRFHSLLAVPLALDGRPIGALNVQTAAPRDYTAAEIDMLALLGDLAAGALVKARLYDRQRRQLDELRALAAVSEAVTSPQYLDEILDVVTQLAAQMAGATACTIYLLEPPDGDAAAPVFANPGGAPLPDEAALATVVATGRPFIAPRLSAAGDAALLAIPLAVQERVIGVLACLAPPDHAFSESQRTLLTTLANQTALAIENARLVTSAAVVREMHHRIKNNLQTVAALLRLQMNAANSAAARPALQESINRVMSIATVHEVLAGASIGRVDARDLAERVTLQERLDQLQALSESEPEMRSELARALAIAPRVLVCDEPFAGVDPRGAEALGALLASLAREDEVGVILADHHVEEALRVTTRALLLLDGAVAASGTPDEFREHPLVRGRYLGTIG